MILKILPVLGLVLLTACTSTVPPVSSSASPEPVVPAMAPVEPEMLIQPDAEVPPPVDCEPSTVPVAAAYDFSSPVPLSSPVENDFFADAVFVGDSRMDGFYLYSGVKRGKRLTAAGMSVFNMSSKKTVKVDGISLTPLEALERQRYGKVYLGVGINELGYISTEKFYTTYCSVVDAIRVRQPGAVIYLLNLSPVNEKHVRAAGGAGHLNNERIRLYNDLIARAAAEKNVPLLDLYTELAIDGQLPADAARDGVHLTKEYCRRMLDYLKSHTVDFPTLYPQEDVQ